MGNAQSSDRHVVVLGAGPAGLATAHELSKRGAKVTVLERNSYVGGLCRTIDYKGYRFDLGGHRWFSKNEDLNAWFRRLMGDEVVYVDRTSRIFHSGTFYHYPIEIGNVVSKTPALTLVYAGLSYAWARIKYGLLGAPIRHIRDAFTAQFGSKLFDMFFRQYTEKVWGKPCDSLSADWVSQRSKGLSIMSVLANALSPKPSDATSLIERFMYPRTGYMRIAQRMADDVIAHGNTVTLDATATRVEHLGAHAYRVHYLSGGSEQTIEATDVVSTLPLTLLARMMTPNCPPAVTEAANGLEFRDLITVNVIIDKPQVSKDTWLYVQNRDIVFGRLHEPKNWSSAMVPNEATTSLVLECFCFENDTLWQSDDATIAQRCIDGLADHLGFINADEVIDWTVVRTRHAYPIYDLEYADKIAVIRDFLADFKGLEIAGRGGTFRYNNADHSIEMGLLLAREMLGLGGDHMAVNTDSSYQELASDQDDIRQRVLDPDSA